MALPPVNFDLTKPATVFIEKVSEAVGGIAKPWQMKRVAKAETEVAQIRALGQLELSEIEQRGLERIVRQEARRQENIESITAKAIPEIDEGSRPEELELDWLNRFFEHAKDVSDEEMQSVWAKILSQKTKDPELFSLKTLELVSLMDKSDADLFTRFCETVWMFGGPTSIVFKTKGKEGDYFGISFTEMNHLDAIGLITFSTASSYIKHGKGNTIRIFYYGSPVEISFGSAENFKINTGSATLTRAGQELCRIAGSEPSRSLYEKTISQWVEDGHTVSTPLVGFPANSWMRGG